jgi:hypothetical protein
VLLDGTPVLDGLDDDDAARDGARGETVPKAVTDHDDYVEKFGPTGGWADVDHARWRRCLSRANMNYGAAVLLAAEELSAFGIERQEVIRHARWDAARDDLFEKKKEAVKKWRAKQREAAAAHRAKLDAEHDAKERLRATKASAELAAQRSREKEALREWKEKKRLEEENRKLCAAANDAAAAEARAERLRLKKIERAERDARNAWREQARVAAAENARIAAEKAAAALIPSAPPTSQASAKAERERLAKKALQARIPRTGSHTTPFAW